MNAPTALPAENGYWPCHENSTANNMLVREMIDSTICDKPYQYAIHCPRGSLDGDDQPHVHVIYSDRKPDGIQRSAEQHLRRYNPSNPTAGGCKKDSGGKNSVELREEVIGWRGAWADIQNRALEKYGHDSRVDHRSLEAQGVEREPEIRLSKVLDQPKAHAAQRSNGNPVNRPDSGRPIDLRSVARTPG